MTSGAQSPFIRDLSWWSDLKEDDLWTCTVDVPECAIYPHTNPMDLMGLSGTIKAGILLDSTLFSSGAASYQWGYESCKPSGSNTPVTTTLSINGVNTPFSDAVPDCSTVTKLRYNGTWDLGSDRTIWITMSSPWGGGKFNQSTIYLGHFALDVQPLDRSALSSLQSSSLQTGSSSSQATSATTGSATASASASSGTSASSLTNSTSITGQSASASMSQIQSLSESEESSATAGENITNASVGGNSTDAMQTKLPGIVGGVVGGVCVILIVLFFLWRSHRRRREARVDPLDTQDEEEWAPYTIPSGAIPGTDHGILYAGGKNRPPSTTPQLVHLQEALMAEALSPNTDDDHAPRTGSTSESSHAQPITSIPNLPTSPATTAGGLPAYDTYMDAPLVTFRRARIPQDTIGQDNPVVEDSMHQWAEDSREFIPPHLESRLRAGGYVPGSNPRNVAADVWLSRFGVTRYELAGLQELYERENT